MGVLDSRDMPCNCDPKERPSQEETPGFEHLTEILPAPFDRRPSRNTGSEEPSPHTARVTTRHSPRNCGAPDVSYVSTIDRTTRTLRQMWNAAAGRKDIHHFSIRRSQDLGGSMVRPARQAQWSAGCGLAATAGAISTRPAIVEALRGLEIKTRCRLSRGLAGKPNRAAAATTEQNAAKGQLLDSRSRAPAAAGLGCHPRRLPGC